MRRTSYPTPGFRCESGRSDFFSLAGITRKGRLRVRIPPCRNGACSYNWKNVCLASSTMGVRISSGPPSSVSSMEERPPDKR
jgi:hypothetical protein